MDPEEAETIARFVEWKRKCYEHRIKNGGQPAWHLTGEDIAEIDERKKRREEWTKECKQVNENITIFELKNSFGDLHLTITCTVFEDTGDQSIEARAVSKTLDEHKTGFRRIGEAQAWCESLIPPATLR